MVWGAARRARRWVGNIAVAAAISMALLGAGPFTQVAEAAATPSNDVFANSQAIAMWNGSVAGTTVGASRQSGEPVSGSQFEVLGDGPSVWYSWTAPADGLVQFDTYTISSEFVPAVAVYTGGSVSTLSDVAFDWCHSDSGWSDVSCYYVAVTSGTTYHIQVATPSGSSYPFNLRWTRVIPPQNDNFGNATVLQGTNTEAPDLQPRSGGLATGQVAEPRHSWEWGSPSHSVWYRWTAPFSASVTIYAEVGDGTSHDVCWEDAALAVYTGSQLSTLQRVVSDDADGGVCDPAQVFFDASPGVTYNIAVDERYSTTPLHLTVSAVPRCDLTGTSSGETLVGTPGVDVICGLVAMTSSKAKAATT
jgi:hypothetical protein